MINIISSFGDKAGGRGPGKVFANLTKGLNQIGYPFVVNRELNATRRLWIHDDVTALYSLNRTPACKVLGPNLFLLPSDISPAIDFRDALYVQPSTWARDFWERAGFHDCPTSVWPVGVDTEAYVPGGDAGERRQILLYHKKRDSGELHRIQGLLDKLRLPYRLIVYGEYREPDFQQALASARFAIWHGCHESQGIALEEALACDVPILVCDVSTLSEERGGDKLPAFLRDTPATAAPYFDRRCGIKIKGLAGFEAAAGFMIDHLKEFSPRQYVLENLTLRSQARAFVDLWQHWGLTYAEGLQENASSQAGWHPPLSSRVRVRVERKMRPSGFTRRQANEPSAAQIEWPHQRSNSMHAVRRRVKLYLTRIPSPAIQRLLTGYLDARYEASERSKYEGWMRAGKPVPPPPYYKQLLLRRASQSFGIRVLVETGTFEGRTVQALRKDFQRIYSVEFDDALYQAARLRFAGFDTISILHGNSGVVLKQLLPTLREACVFWLDAHHSGGATSRAEKDSPILEELDAIAERPLLFGDVIFIDDARHFGGGDYPPVETIRSWAHARGYEHFEVTDDVIRIHRKSPSPKLNEQNKA